VLTIAMLAASGRNIHDGILRSRASTPSTVTARSVNGDPTTTAMLRPASGWNG
jgi:hypothetical protein